MQYFVLSALDFRNAVTLEKESHLLDTEKAMLPNVPKCYLKLI